MSYGIEPARHPAHHRPAGPGDRGSDQATGSGAVRRVIPAAYDRRRGPIQEPEIAESKEQERRLGNIAKGRRKPVVIGQECLGPEAFHRGEHAFTVGRTPLGYGRGGGSCHARHGAQKRERRRQGAKCAPTRRQERAEPGGPDARRQGQGNVGDSLLVHASSPRISSALAPSTNIQSRSLSSASPAPETLEIASTSAPAVWRVGSGSARCQEIALGENDEVRLLVQRLAIALYLAAQL